MAKPVEMTHKELSIPWSVIIIAGAVILLGLFILISVLTKSVSRVECKSQTCFEKQFSSCHPAEWIYALGYEQEKYVINGKAKSGCSVTFTNNTDSNINITCNFDNKTNFTSAQSEADSNPTKYDCRQT